MTKKIPFKYASLNCNSIGRAKQSSTQSSLIRYLRLQQFDILSLQETNASTSSIPSLNILFQARQTFWTEHCGMISFSPTYILTPVTTEHIFKSNRYLLCQVQHPHQFYEPFHILNIYAPASSNPDRRNFFLAILNMLTELTDTIDLTRLIVSGDFNYDYLRDIASGKANHKTNPQWVSFLQESFYNCMMHNDLDTIPTFQRNVEITSCIDYIYAGTSLQYSILDTAIEYLNSDWADHALLNVSFNLGKSKVGPGLWRANPAYANNPQFRKKLSARLQSLMETMPTSLSTQEQWEEVKTATSSIIKQFGIKYVSWRKLSLKHLERKRNRLLRSKPPTATLIHFLPKIDNMIHVLQQELVDIASLKAGVTWRENGEKSAGYLKAIHQHRSTQQYISALREPNVSTTTIAQESNTTPTVATDIKQMRVYAQQFYQSLYTADPVPEHSIEAYLNGIQFHRTLDSDEQDSIMQPIELDELIVQATRSTKISSPGADGLSYPYINLLFNNVHIQDLIKRVYNEALSGLFPKSWKDIRVRLLPKKGDLSSLKNHRPISLINCDAKVFTRLITQRLGPLVKKLLNPYQSGFVPGKFIGDNGLALSMVLEQAKSLDLSGVGILLDQEKAYDRVNAGYLRNTLHKFAFPPAFIDCIHQLFFGNEVRININGFFTDPIIQERGLRQGDPLSPLLFNLALEPFLLSILQDQQMIGYQSPSTLTSMLSEESTSNLKCLAYADDVCVLLHDQNDLHRLKFHMADYGRVSNARFNEHKSEAFALNGKRDASWADKLGTLRITTYHHQGCTEPFRYLGYYLPYTTRQRAHLEDNLIAIVKSGCKIYSQRQVSIRGRVTIMNTLILTKVWYPLRLFKPTAKFFNTLKMLIYQFIWQKKTPRIRKEVIFLPWESGGLKVHDPAIQHRILQKRWLNYLVDPSKHPSFVRPLMLQHLSLFHNSALYPHLPLYDPEYRKGPAFKANMSLWSVIFKAFDYFVEHTQLQLDCIPVETILNMPLHKILVNINDSHWSRKHPSYPTHRFLVFDNIQNRMRLKVTHEYVRFPRLCEQLYRDILQYKTVNLQPFVWPHIMDPPREFSVEWVTQTLKADLTDNITWNKFTPQQFRQSYQQNVAVDLLFSKRIVNIFWSCPMYPQARSIYYRAISGCIPTKQVRFKYGTVSSPICPVCDNADDTIRHFLVDCPPKWKLWSDLLLHHFPLVSISPELLYSTLGFLHIPHGITNTNKYFSVVSTALWKLWNFYWELGRLTEPKRPIDNLSRLLPQVISATERLLNPIIIDNL
jgi:exonuclease III